MGRVPPDLTGQLSLVPDAVETSDDDAVEAAAAPQPARSAGRTKGRRPPRKPAGEPAETPDPDTSVADEPAQVVADDQAADGPSAAAGSRRRDRDSTSAPPTGDHDVAHAGDAVGSAETPVAVAPPVELVISEVFGPTFQGEGPSLGRRAGFVRLGRCNLDCTWCDTPYTWDWSRYDADTELSNLTVDDVVAHLEQMAPEIVVVTGGEPLLQQRRLLPLLQACANRGWPVEVETNGTRTPDEAIVPLVAQWNVSPKLANSGVAARRAIRPQALAAFQSTGRAVFKFVVADEDDLDEIAKLVKHHDLAPIWVMPEGTDPTTILSRSRRLADTVLARGWNFTTRLHTLLWGDTRGR